MKTTLWATLSANGNYARSTAEHPPKPEALGDFAAHVQKTGCFIVGRRTFEGFRAGNGPSLGPIDIVVVTRSEIPSVRCARTPREALDQLAKLGHTAAVIAGGESLHNACLADDLVDELVFNVAPALEDEGLKVVLPKGGHRDVRLLGVSELGSGVVQLRYALDRAR
jgi:dihydrofolate reductase